MGAESSEPVLRGVRAIVTGGTSGLGLAMARALVGAGARVALTGRRPARARQVAEEVGHDAGRGAGGSAVGVGMDVRDEESVASGVAQARDALGGLDLLVNNAGIGMRTVNPAFLSDPRPFWEVSPAGWRDVIATNLTGYFLVAREVAPGFVAQGAGRIVNISLNYETMRRRGFVPYGPSRAGAEALSRVMAADLAGTGVTVNILLPGGATATGMIPEGLPESARAGLLDPAIMGPPIVYLASPAAADVHDERIVASEFEGWLASREMPGEVSG